jgi:DNA-binding NarL/FixJ family response regulator
LAEAVSQAVARVMLSERLERLRIDAATAARSVEQLIEERCCEGVSLAMVPPSAPAPADAGEDRVRTRPASYAPAHASSRLAGLLTAREIEVLKLMAAGETNAGIARELVISEGTVKSHVKSVLRKLRVANRAQAVARYFRVMRAEETA